MRLPHRTTFPLISALLLLSACSVSMSSDDEPTCDDADQVVVDDIMSTARTNFQDGDSIMRDFDFLEAATAPIPKEKRQFGAAELMVLLVAVNIDDDRIPGGLQGAQGPVYVVLDADGEPLGPLGTFSQPFFDIQPPADPGWTPWADAIDDSDVAYDLFGCVTPNPS